VSVIPRVFGREIASVLARLGYEKDRQKGSHIVLRQTAHPHRRLVAPDHKEIAKGILRAIIKQAGLTIDEFNALFK
jgi:predicted RNA binding protein YcfA (HicA-like mRNA interferase family)